MMVSGLIRLKYLALPSDFIGLMQAEAPTLVGQDWDWQL